MSEKCHHQNHFCIKNLQGDQNYITRLYYSSDGDRNEDYSVTCMIEITLSLHAVGQFVLNFSKELEDMQ